MKNNPYTLSFGTVPTQQIARNQETAKIFDEFNSDQPSQYMYIITGVRGSGKTVLMSEMADKFGKEKNWIVVSLNPEMDLLTGLASKLSNEQSLVKKLKADKVNLSFFGFGVELSTGPKITDIEVALEKILQSVKKQGKKVLVTIDEATANENMKIFAGSYQILIRNGLPLFLLMTGLYENIYALQNEKNLTFLWRAPKIDLQMLNIGAITDNYRRNLRTDLERSTQLAKETLGYAYAFQVLGWQIYEKGDTDEAMADYKLQLDQYVYEKIWSELSRKDKKVLYACANTPSHRILDIRETLNMSTNQFNPYRMRLIRKGILNGNERGYLYFSLPLFDRYVIENYYE